MNTVEFLNLAPTEPDMFWSIKQNVYWLNCYSYFFVIWASQLIRGLFHSDISFICWFRGLRAPFCVFSSLSIYCQGCWRTRWLWFRSSYSWSWRVGDKGWGGCCNSQCLGGLFAGFPDLGLFSSTAKVLGFLGFSIQIKGILLYCVQ
jgi:hypothetical protein